jgi:tRNA nucleotidyltransferase (CCA-adding enzyme)
MNLKLARPLPPPSSPALGILRLAALSAGSDRGLDEETLALMSQQVSAGVLNNLVPAELWPELAAGLMAQTPSNMFGALHNCGALEIVLPEIAALFGVHQIASDPPQVDIGGHLLRVLDETARNNAPMPVRFAALVILNPAVTLRR